MVKDIIISRTVDDEHDQHRTVAPTTTAAREATTDNVNPEANLPAVVVHTECQAVVPSTEPTTLSAGTTPILEAYLAPELRRNTTIEVVDAVVWDDTDIIRRSDTRKWWAFLFGATLCVGAVIALSLWWTRNIKEEDQSIALNDPPSSAPTTIFSSTGRLGDILREIMSHFESPTLEQDLTNPQSPQYLAALWMAEKDEHPATANLTYPLNQTSLDLLQFRQRYALATFYYATDGDKWGEKCNFLTPSRHVCEWNCGVKDDPFHGFPGQFSRIGIMGAGCGQSFSDELDEELPVLDDLVLRLELINNGLSKTIPDEIQGLDVLVWFHMSFQFLTGTLPLDALANTLIAKKPHIFADQLGTDHYLQSIEMENTTLSGTLPSAIGNLPSLEIIWMWQNNFSGTIPSTIGLLTSLRHLVFSETSFNGTIPPEIYNMTSLVILNFDYCELTGTIPEPTRILPLLTTLRLYGNNLSGTLPKGMDKLPKLVGLWLLDNALTGEVPSRFGELVNLQDVDLRNNFLSGKLLEQPFLYNLTALSGLALGYNLFSGTISTDIGLLSNLTALDVRGRDIHSTADEQARRLMGTIPTEFGRLSKLEWVNLGGNQLTGPIPTEIVQLPLYHLGVNHNELTGTFPTELALLSDIDLLWLEGNSITGSLEPFCASFIAGYYGGGEFDDHVADCREPTVNCSCCTKCCDEDDQCISMQS